MSRYLNYDFSKVVFLLRRLHGLASCFHLYHRLLLKYRMCVTQANSLYILGITEPEKSLQVLYIFVARILALSVRIQAGKYLNIVKHNVENDCLMIFVFAAVLVHYGL